MDLEALSKNLGSMDAQNITSLLLSLISQLGGKRGRKRPTETDGLFLTDTAINQSSTMVEDTEILAHNLTTILMKNYMNDSALWDAIAVNLENEEIRWKEEANRRLSYVTSIIIIVIYTCVIAIGSFGNLLVVSAVARQPSLRTPRNVFIINLAVSDLLLCLVTMPLTLVEMVNDHWPLGDSVVSCKVAGGLQAVSVFVSTLSITAIALDRYQLIVYPTKDILKTIGAAVGLGFIWMLGFLLASPIFIFRTLEHHDLDSTNKRRAEAGADYSSGGVHSIDYCYEKWPVSHGRAIYSACTLLIQYLLPILIISFLHSQICQRLRNRHSTIGSMRSQQESERQVKEAKRLRRRHHLLMTIALVFSITWLPLNVLNLVLDLYNPYSLPLDEETMLIIYAVCHLFGMSSACANPFLYGWFNDNFRNEFRSMLTAPIRLCFGNNNGGRCCCPSTSRRMFEASPCAVVVRSPTSSPVGDASGQRRFAHRESKIDMEEGSTVISGAFWQPISSTTEEQITGDDHHKMGTTTSSLPTEREEVISMKELPHSFDAGSSRANDAKHSPPASVHLVNKPLFETHL